MSKERPRIRWADDELAQAWKIIHYQDVLIAGLAVTISEINRYEYDGFWDFQNNQEGPNLRGILHFSNLIRLSADILLRTRDGKPGANPRWYVVTENVLYFIKKVFEMAKIIVAEVRRNDWEIIMARLIECKAQCRGLQEQLLWLIPPDRVDEPDQVNEAAVVDWLTSTDTIREHRQIKGSLGSRYRRKK